mmetsp:Transcript_118815/g.281941  ORF Transcript_118815/g.281941 Transcript_118815/m.281941 type:complete len:213 (-) Transcript_118815:28-666(-)
MRCIFIRVPAAVACITWGKIPGVGRPLKLLLECSQVFQGSIEVYVLARLFRGWRSSGLSGSLDTGPFLLCRFLLDSRLLRSLPRRHHFWCLGQLHGVPLGQASLGLSRCLSVPRNWASWSCGFCRLWGCRLSAVWRKWRCWPGRSGEALQEEVGALRMHAAHHVCRRHLCQSLCVRWKCSGGCCNPPLQKVHLFLPGAGRTGLLRQLAKELG